MAKQPKESDDLDSLQKLFEQLSDQEKMVDHSNMVIQEFKMSVGNVEKTNRTFTSSQIKDLTENSLGKFILDYKN